MHLVDSPQGDQGTFQFKQERVHVNYQLSQAWSGVEQLRKRIDVFTGGGFRALAKRRLRFLREKLGRLDRNHWRALMKLMATKSPPGDVNFPTAENCATGTKTTEPKRLPQQGSEISRSINVDNQGTRDQILLAPVSREAHIIEIGPSYNPIAPKAGGWNTKTLDHTTREKLIAHYRGQPGVDVNRIEEVDFIWTGGPLADAVPKALHGTFDALVASHVIEHTPNLIAFLNSAAVLLKADGVVALAIPDKRYCFDYFQPLTTTGQLLAAHAEQRSRHTRRVAFDHVAYAVNNGGVGAWGQQPTQELRFFHTVEEARKLFDLIEKREDYVDLHAWRFTPASFELLLLELARLGETNWCVDRVTPANGCEFFAWLRRGGAARAASLSDADIAEQRLALLKRTLVETKDQIDWLLTKESPGAIPQTALPVAALSPPAPAHSQAAAQCFVDWFPAPENAAWVFEGEWSSAVPGLPTGKIGLFEDGRILWFEEKLGGFAGVKVLELGPLEGGHTYMMTQRGAEVIAIESNLRAWLRCLVVKQAVPISGATFLLGDFTKYFNTNRAHFDFILAQACCITCSTPLGYWSAWQPPVTLSGCGRTTSIQTFSSFARI